MKRNSIIILFVALSLTLSCSPVRSRYNKGSGKESGKETSQSKSPAQKPIYKMPENPPEYINQTDAGSKSLNSDNSRDSYLLRNRFADTTVIELSENFASSSQSSIIRKFDDVVASFDREEYDIACGNVQQFIETFAIGDSLYYEALFIKSECLILRDDISSAEAILSALIKDSKLPKLVLEKVIVRLGQVNCVLKKETEAKKLFARLKKEFPKSIYLPLANCDAVR